MVWSTIFRADAAQDAAEPAPAPWLAPALQPSTLAAWSLCDARRTSVLLTPPHPTWSKTTVKGHRGADAPGRQEEEEGASCVEEGEEAPGPGGRGEPQLSELRAPK